MNDKSSLTPLGASESVPVYSFTVLISKTEDNRYLARVANLAETEIIALSEREALQKITLQIKQVLSECIKEEKKIPWLDTPLEKSEAEQERFLAIHL